MSELIHITDDTDEASSYCVISKNLIRMMTGLLILCFVCLLGLALIAIANRLLIIDTKNLADNLESYLIIQEQRNLAIDELLLKRASIQIFSYNKACQYAREKGEACLDNPQLWADVEKYPLLKNNKSGSGLFPKIAISDTNK